MSAKWTFHGVCFLHVKEVFVKATVACDELDGRSVVFSVVDEGGVDVIDRLA